MCSFFTMLLRKVLRPHFRDEDVEMSPPRLLNPGQVPSIHTRLPLTVLTTLAHLGTTLMHCGDPPPSPLGGRGPRGLHGAVQAARLHTTRTGHCVPLHLGDVLCEAETPLKVPVTDRKAPGALAFPFRASTCPSLQTALSQGPSA